MGQRIEIGPQLTILFFCDQNLQAHVKLICELGVRCVPSTQAVGLLVNFQRVLGPDAQATITAPDAGWHENSRGPWHHIGFQLHKLHIILQAESGNDLTPESEPSHYSHYSHYNRDTCLTQTR